MNYKFDVIVIGAGPAGYVCAIRCAQLGLKTACVDKRNTLGGTCLNIGCIPSKALLHSSYLYHQAHTQWEKHGIRIDGQLQLDIARMLERKQSVVQELTKGIDYLFKKNGITRLEGLGSLAEGNLVHVREEEDKIQTYSADHIVIATGSSPASLPGIAVDEKDIVTSTGALSFDRVPDHLVVVGGGYIGLEMGSIWARLGAKVTVIEFAQSIIPNMDRDIRTQAQKFLEAQGLSFNLGHKVSQVTRENNHITVTIESFKEGKKSLVTCDKLLVAAGRKPYTADLNLEKLGVALDERGYIQVDRSYKTSVPGIYAIGDVIPGPMLAHKGEEEGIAVAQIIAGKWGHVNYKTIPSVMYTHPEVAGVGLTEDLLQEQGRSYRVGKFPFLANSRAKGIGETTGFVKILVDQDNDEILGAHIIGPDAGTLIQEIVLAMEYKGSAEDIALTCHAHPGLSEAVKEAALEAHGCSIHI